MTCRSFELSPTAAQRAQNPENRHIPFYVALEMAWKACEMEIGDALDRRELRGDQIAIAHLEADFQGELVEGEAEFDVRIHRVGTSSVDFRVVVAREGGIAATVSVTLVHVDPQTKTSVPLSQEHRGALASRVAG